MPEMLLSTKLFLPPLRPDMVRRPKLAARIAQGFQSGHKLSLISAPAGFGKTTLVSEWVDGLRMDGATAGEPPVSTGWISLDERDSDLRSFLSYCIAALSKVEGIDASVGTKTLALAQSAPDAAVERVLTPLINEVAAAAGRIILVLDDYHLIDTQPIHDALSFWLEHMPAHMHLVIITREDPNLPLSRLRARGHLTELRAADLRFSSAEVAEFLNRVMGLKLSVDDIAALETRTEGWISGLQLAAVSMQGHQDAAALIKSFAGSHRFVLDYLIEEVLERQTKSVQKFLLQTSVLDRLTGTLCDALTGSDNGKATLEILDRANMFMVRLDEERKWYRYHHLFADLLNHRLHLNYPDLVQGLHLRASEWYEREGLPADSIRHALAAEDFDRAADLAELSWPTMSGSYQSIAWLGWLKGVPDEVVRVRPVLAMGYTWAHLNSGNLEEAEARLRDAERWLLPNTEADDVSKAAPSQMVVVDEAQFHGLPVSLATARAYHAQAVGDLSGTVKYARRVLELVPEDETKGREDATVLMGLAQWANGDLAAADQAFSGGIAESDPLDIIVGTFVLADVKVTLGELRAAFGAYERALRLAMEHGEPMPIGTEDLYSGRSKLHCERGDLEAAAEDLAASKRLGDQVALPDWKYRWYIAKARLMETRGELDEALEMLRQAERVYVRTPLPDLRPTAASRARIWIAQGRLAEAASWARERQLSPGDAQSYLREFEYITLARLLVAQFRSDGKVKAIHEAMGLIERLLKAAEEGGRAGSVIEIRVLEAVAHEAQGNAGPGLASLEAALRLAEPEGFCRLFVDEGPPMARLLFQAISQGISKEYAQWLLAAFPKAEPVQPKPTPIKRWQSEWIEPLSGREIEVLQHIAEGLTNQEIANRLYLSLNTVKVHTRNINSKLGVNNRTKAVASARALGILPLK